MTCSYLLQKQCIDFAINARPLCRYMPPNKQSFRYRSVIYYTQVSIVHLQYVSFKWFKLHQCGILLYLVARSLLYGIYMYRIYICTARLVYICTARLDVTNPRVLQSLKHSSYLNFSPGLSVPCNNEILWCLSMIYNRDIIKVFYRCHTTVTFVWYLSMPCNTPSPPPPPPQQWHLSSIDCMTYSLYFDCRIWRLAVSAPFEYFIMVMIALNTVILMMKVRNWYPMCIIMNNE